jgi:hypothetical protein
MWSARGIYFEFSVYYIRAIFEFCNEARWPIMHGTLAAGPGTKLCWCGRNLIVSITKSFVGRENDWELYSLSLDQTRAVENGYPWGPSADTTSAGVP